MFLFVYTIRKGSFFLLRKSVRRRHAFPWLLHNWSLTTEPRGSSFYLEICHLIPYFVGEPVLYISPGADGVLREIQ